jgi:TonB family protein
MQAGNLKNKHLLFTGHSLRKILVVGFSGSILLHTAVFLGIGYFWHPADDDVLEVTLVESIEEPKPTPTPSVVVQKVEPTPTTTPSIVVQKVKPTPIPTPSVVVQKFKPTPIPTPSVVVQKFKPTSTPIPSIEENIVAKWPVTPAPKKNSSPKTTINSAQPILPEPSYPQSISSSSNLDSRSKPIKPSNSPKNKPAAPNNNPQNSSRQNTMAFNSLDSPGNEESASERRNTGGNSSGKSGSEGSSLVHANGNLGIGKPPGVNQSSSGGDGSRSQSVRSSRALAEPLRRRIANTNNSGLPDGNNSATKRSANNQLPRAGLQCIQNCEKTDISDLLDLGDEIARGEVVIEINVDPNGIVQKAIVAKSGGDSRVDERVRNNVKKMRFAPPGKSTSTKVTSNSRW